MAAVTVTVDDLSTGDAVPSSSPYKISAQSGKNIASLLFTMSASVIRFWAIVRNGTLTTGKQIERQGAMCGVSRCGTGAGPLALAGPIQLAKSLPYSSLNDGGADGARTINIYAAD